MAGSFDQRHLMGNESHSSEPSIHLPSPSVGTQTQETVRQASVGYYISCPACERELKVNGKYVGERIQCKRCQQRFEFLFPHPDLQIQAVYTTCPHCAKSLRAGTKYLGLKVVCKFCEGTFTLD